MPPLKLPDVNHQPDYDTLDSLDNRYFDAQTARYLSERSRLAYQAYVEVALAHTLAEFGICSPAVASHIEAAALQLDAEAVYAEEAHTKHDIKALVNCIKLAVPDEAKPYVHFGATSYDIIMTANALQLRAATHELILPRLRALLQTLLELADRYADTVQIGRTHGQHAVPVTFGFVLAEYINRLGENMLALRGLSRMLRGKFSGAVGAYNALSLFVDDPSAFERSLLAKLDLEPASCSTQIIPAEQTIRLVDELSITAGILANLAHDMRHLQRTEIAEVRERFEPGQTGSSTMAHKRNPLNFENVISMSKQVAAQALNANMNIVSEHQRDLTDSASSRFYPVAFGSVAAMLQRLQTVMSQLEVDETAMQRNLQLTGGAIAAEPLYLLLEKYGHTQAHEAAKEVAHQALADQQPLAAAVQQAEELIPYWSEFSDAERRIIEHPERYYTGLAAQKTRQLIEYWSAQLTDDKA